jgi:hypothetical protein
VASSSCLLGILVGMLWPLFKRCRRGGLRAVQALVPGIASEICRLGAGLGVAWGIGAQGSNDSRVSKDPLRDVAGSSGRPGIRLEIRSSGRGSNHGRITS